MKEFWKEYKRVHYFYLTRLLHSVGTVIGIYLVILGIIDKQWWVSVSGVFAAYSIAWISHKFIECNSPLTLKAPIRSFLCDCYMTMLIIIGKNPK